jgi:hypothetical protein
LIRFCGQSNHAADICHTRNWCHRMTKTLGAAPSGSSPKGFADQAWAKVIASH